VVDKAILLLNRKADISCRDYNGDTVLHTVLKCSRLHEDLSYKKAERAGGGARWIQSLEDPKDLLIVFITAGVDVYAANNDGKTPSMVAREHGRDEEWIEALELCGYNAKEVLSDPYPKDCTRKYQKSKLSFEEYCQQRQKRPRFEEFHPVNDEFGSSDEEGSMVEDSYTDDTEYADDNGYADEDGHEDEDDNLESDDGEIDVVTENTKCGDGNLESLVTEECTLYGTNPNLVSTGVVNVDAIV
jgi:hypothetical protein